MLRLLTSVYRRAPDLAQSTSLRATHAPSLTQPA